jgi:signal transduction histidine kinase
LGLAIVKGYAELLGAGLEITSELGKGSIFKIVLPAPLNKEAFAATGV